MDVRKEGLGSRRRSSTTTISAVQCKLPFPWALLKISPARSILPMHIAHSRQGLLAPWSVVATRDLQMRAHRLDWRYDMSDMVLGYGPIGIARCGWAVAERQEVKWHSERDSTARRGARWRDGRGPKRRDPGLSSTRTHPCHRSQPADRLLAMSALPARKHTPNHVTNMRDRHPAICMVGGKPQLQTGQSYCPPRLSVLSGNSWPFFFLPSRSAEFR